MPLGAVTTGIRAVVMPPTGSMTSVAPSASVAYPRDPSLEKIVRNVELVPLIRRTCWFELRSMTPIDGSNWLVTRASVPARLTEMPVGTEPVGIAVTILNGAREIRVTVPASNWVTSALDWVTATPYGRKSSARRWGGGDPFGWPKT